MECDFYFDFVIIVNGLLESNLSYNNNDGGFLFRRHVLLMTNFDGFRRRFISRSVSMKVEVSNCVTIDEFARQVCEVTFTCN